MSDTLRDRLSHLKKSVTELEERFSGLNTEVTELQETFIGAKRYINDELPITRQATDDIRAFKEAAQTTTQEIQTILTQAKESLSAVVEGENTSWEKSSQMALGEAAFRSRSLKH